MITDIDVARKYCQLSDSARARGIQFELSLKKVRQILTRKRCYYTGVTLRRDVEADHPNKLTVDRKDASLGYIDDNVVACSHRFNQKKGSLTAKDIAILARKVL